MERGDSLKKQLEILIDLKSAIQNRRQTPDSKEDSSISYTISCGKSSNFSCFKCNQKVSVANFLRWVFLKISHFVPQLI